MADDHDLPRLLWRPGEACQILGIGATSFWGLVRRGDLEVARIGGCTRVHDAELRRFAAVRAGLSTEAAWPGRSAQPTSASPAGGVASARRGR